MNCNGCKKCGLKLTGAPSLEELKVAGRFPSEEERMKGPLAVIECIEEIPCNPCESACPQDAIHVGVPITNLPAIDYDKCIGCGICIACCPGLAICVRDYTYSSSEATISFPYEYLPIPEKGQAVKMVDRQGQVVCDGIILRVNNAPANHSTAVVTAVFPKEYYEQVISIRRL